ncbi:MAG: hypothetical protein IPH74_04225 [Bacteroidetes bacterium]|nr:hypothetical protein [Bacteroidota bacterium]
MVHPFPLSSLLFTSVWCATMVVMSASEHCCICLPLWYPLSLIVVILSTCRFSLASLAIPNNAFLSLVFMVCVATTSCVYRPRQFVRTSLLPLLALYKK